MHDIARPHTHEPLDHPGLFHERDVPLGRNYGTRSFTVGVGGPVGSATTALLLAICLALRETYSLAVVTNDTFTGEDAEVFVRNRALPAERIRAFDAGGGRPAASRGD